MSEIDRTKYLRDLRRQIVTLFSSVELRTLAFDLSVDWDRLEGQEISGKCQSLILHLARRGRLNDLMIVLHEERPDAKWPDVPSSGQQKKDENEITPASLREATLQDYLRTLRNLLGPDPKDEHEYSETTLAIARELTDAVMSRLDKPRLGTAIRFLGSKNLASIITATDMNLMGVNFIGANLRGIGFNRALLSGSRFFQANLSNADLSEADFSNADLSAANLTEANLFGAILDKSDLTEAKLRNADLTGALLNGANLTRARLNNVNLRRASLRGANLHEAEVNKVSLIGADLQGANLTLATLYEANLGGANLSGADLGGAKLDGATLIEANLYKADLSDTCLSDANLSGANMRGAELVRSNLAGAILDGADLVTANLNEARNWTLDQLELTTVYNTTMPDGLYVGLVAYSSISSINDRPPKKGYSYEEWKSQYQLDHPASSSTQ